MLNLEIFGDNGPLHQPYMSCEVDKVLSVAGADEGCPMSYDCPFIKLDGELYQVLEFSLKIRPGAVPVEFKAYGLTKIEGDLEPPEPNDCTIFLQARPAEGSKCGDSLKGFDIGRLRNLGRALPNLSYLEVCMKKGKPLEVKIVLSPDSLHIALENVGKTELVYDEESHEQSLFDFDLEAVEKARLDFMRDHKESFTLLEDA